MPAFNLGTKKRWFRATAVFALSLRLTAWASGQPGEPIASAPNGRSTQVASADRGAKVGADATWTVDRCAKVSPDKVPLAAMPAGFQYTTWIETALPTEILTLGSTKQGPLTNIRLSPLKATVNCARRYELSFEVAAQDAKVTSPSPLQAQIEVVCRGMPVPLRVEIAAPAAPATASPTAPTIVEIATKIQELEAEFSRKALRSPPRDPVDRDGYGHVRFYFDPDGLPIYLTDTRPYVTEGDVIDAFLIVPPGTRGKYSLTVGKFELVAPAPAQVLGQFTASAGSALIKLPLLPIAPGATNISKSRLEHIRVMAGPFSAGTGIVIKVTPQGTTTSRDFPISIHPLYRFAARFGTYTSSLSNKTFKPDANGLLLETAQGPHLQFTAGVELYLWEKAGSDLTVPTHPLLQRFNPIFAFGLGEQQGLNYFYGVAYEVLSGVELTIGAHTERVNFAANPRTIGQHWETEPFFGVTFPADVFTRVVRAAFIGGP